MSLPLVGYLSAAEGVRLSVAVRERAARVYAGMEDVPDLVVCSDRSRFARIGEQRGFMRRIRAEAAIVLAPSFSTALAPFLAGVGVRGGVRFDARTFLLNTSLPSAGLRDQHLSKTYLELGRRVLERLGLRSDGDFAAPRIRVWEKEREAVRGRLRALGIGVEYAVVVPGAAYGPTKRWPSAKYRELVGALSSEVPVVLGGSAGERSLCEEVGGGLGGVSNIAGRTTLGEFMALLEGARFVVANDSGTPHVAASLGVPVVAIFGSTSPAWTAPLGDRVQVVREPVHCSPCFRKRCPTKLECFDGISVARVVAAARGAMGDPEKKVSPRDLR